jgi:vancomycin resistance protein YoaR
MEAKIQHPLKTSLFVVIGLVVFFVLAASALYMWTERFDERIAPNVTIGPLDVGGLNAEVARQILQTKIDQILLDGIDVNVENSVKPIALATIVSSDAIEDVNFSIDEAIAKAAQAKHSSNILLNAWWLISNLWQPVHISLSVTISQENIKQNITRLFPDKETPARNSRFVIKSTESGPVVLTTPDEPGTVFAWESFFEKFSAHLRQLDASEIKLDLVRQIPEVTQALAETQKIEANRWLSQSPPTLNYENEHGKKYEWMLSDVSLLPILIPQANGEVGIDQTVLDEFLNPIALQLERPAQDARIQIENGRAIEFIGSQNGLRLDRDAVRALLIQYFKQEIDDPMILAFVIEEPAVQTADMNDLGIDQILGTGTSSYRGSPINRRKNIQNGVNLLNGILIPPGETFSLLNALKPFDIKNGYLPELVIKGNKITPELGGGLCQIGTTTFRAAMNSGLPILERQNHSLVVSYYNDPSNHNPGTDATIYEPAPDFKFLNDTGHYILFQAENLIDTQELRFTFWGTLDGRKGSYTPPTVQQWIPVGETQYTDTTDLKPGEEKCQEAHIGANASFDYTIVRPDGTIETTTFTSHYRPLPRICLVGVSPVMQSEPQTNTQEKISTE